MDIPITSAASVAQIVERINREWEARIKAYALELQKAWDEFSAANLLRRHC